MNCFRAVFLACIMVACAGTSSQAGATGPTSATPNGPDDKTLETPAAEANPLPKPPKSELERMIGQMIIVGFLGDDSGHPWFQAVAEQVREGKVSGVLYLQRNVRDRAAVKGLNAALRQAGGSANLPLIAVDQEGGRVVRLTEDAGFPPTPSARQVAAELAPRKAYETYRQLAGNLRDWGFNLNLGPVVDLDVNPDNPIIGRYDRSFSADVDTVVTFATVFVQAHRDAGVLSVLKHFPGHGSSTGDTHHGFVDVSQTWSGRELEPFASLIRDGNAELVMTSHVHNAKLQSETGYAPISLSRSGVDGMLRNKLGFDGVVITDDMQMGAILSRYSLEGAAVRAVQAGNDLLIFANDQNPTLDVPERVISALADAAENDPALRSRIRRSNERIAKLKSKLRSGKNGRTAEQ